MKTIPGFLVTVFLFVACSSANSGITTQTLFVGAEQVDCVGVALQKCLLVKENANDDYTFFYDDIEDFEWEEGYEYELLVEVTEIDNSPADDSTLMYKLSEVVSKESIKR